MPALPHCNLLNLPVGQTFLSASGATKGVRKARWSRPGMGKRGGIRVSLREKEDLTDADKAQIRKIVESFQGNQ